MTTSTPLQRHHFMPIAAFLLAWLAPCTLLAQIATDRPDQTESALNVPQGTLQIESGVLLHYAGDAPTSTRQILAPTNLLRYGITNGIELRFLSQFEAMTIGEQKLQGISDLEIGTKIHLFSLEKAGTEAAFLAHLVVPTGTQALSGHTFGITNKLSISHTLSETASIGYNIGYNYFGVGKGDITYTLAFGKSINDKVAVYIEPFGEVTNLETFVSNMDAGFTYLLNPDTQLDFSFGTGVNQRMNYVSLGCSWLFDRD